MNTLSRRVDNLVATLILELKKLNPEINFRRKEGGICSDCELDKLETIVLPKHCIITDNKIEYGFINICFEGMHESIFGKNFYPE